MANNAVAVVVNAQGLTASLMKTGVMIRVFHKDMSGWMQGRELAVELHPEKGLASVRTEANQLIEELGDTRILVAGEISGVTYNAFDTAGYYVFQIPEKQPSEFLDFVLASVEKQIEDLKKLKSGQDGTENIPQPQLNGADGNYFMDIIQAQMDNPNVTTKQLLKPFLKNQTFYELVVVCSHIPPWFDREFSEMKLAYDKEVISAEKYRVTIHPATCE